MIFFNGFDLLMCILSAMAGAVWMHYLIKSNEKFDREVAERKAQRRANSDTPIYDSMVDDFGDYRK
jgi:hypothetical protein